MLNFRMYIPFGRNVDLLNKCVASILAQIDYYSSWDGKKIVIINNSMKPLDGFLYTNECEIWQLPFELTHAQEGNWMVMDAYKTGQPFCATTHTDSELLPGAMEALVRGYETVKGTRWFGIGIASAIFVAYNPLFFIQEKVWWDPFLFPFYYMDNHVGRIAKLRGWSDTLISSDIIGSFTGTTTHNASLIKHVSSHYLKEDKVFGKKNGIAFRHQGAIYSDIWGGLPGHETSIDPYAAGTLPL